MLETTHGNPMDSPTVPCGTIGRDGHMGLGCMEWTYGNPMDNPTVPCSTIGRDGHMGLE